MKNNRLSKKVEFEGVVRQRLVQHSIPKETHMKAYLAIRTLDSALNGPVTNTHRLSNHEFERLVELLDKILPASEKEK